MLGHNGAGKSTLINILTGILGASAGTANVCGLDLGQNIAEVQRLIGLVPQFDILWGELTAGEHLRLFAKLRGVPESDIPALIKQKLAEVNLGNVENSLVRTFSGGMKRRLSVAMGGIGNPKIIIMDEPTTGMDPVNKRSVWKLIRNMKRGKVFILTTHQMEEADVLADRVAIVVDGEVRCVGTPLFLKNHYGQGYRLSLVAETGKVAEVEDLLPKLVPGAKLIDESGGSLVYSVPMDNLEGLKPVFKLMERKSEKPTWGTSSTLGIRPVIYITRETDIASVKEIKVAVDAEFKPAYETQNVVGMIKGAIKPDSFIVVTAHYDNLGMIGKDVNYFGANNSASGVAMLLTLAKHFKVISPYYSVIFIAFGGNELAYAGAQAYVASPPVPLTKIKFLVSFDLAGNGSEGIKVVNGPKYPALLTQLTKINAYYKLLPKIDSRATAPISEHSVFDEKGVPCFFIYSLGGSMAYHNLNDKPELVPFTKFANYQNLMIRFLETFK